jgi:hypothetical protein
MRTYRNLLLHFPGVSMPAGGLSYHARASGLVPTIVTSDNGDAPNDCLHEHLNSQIEFVYMDKINRAATCIAFA